MAPRIFFSLQYFNFNLFFKYETIETHGRAFLTLIILVALFQGGALYIIFPVIVIVLSATFIL
jgi:hypothetical protein